MTQFSLFGAEAAPPILDDLDGLLLAGGHWVRNERGARLSVLVSERWRADELSRAFAELSVDTADGVIVPATEGFAVRTGFDATLAPHAARWTKGANQGLPPGFALAAGGLRLWAIAAGRRDETGFLLATPAADDPMHQRAGAELSRLGVAAISLTQRPGPGWRVTSARRLRRLGELLGPPPPGGAGDWPLAVRAG